MASSFWNKDVARKSRALIIVLISWLWEQLASDSLDPLPWKLLISISSPSTAPCSFVFAWTKVEIYLFWCCSLPLRLLTHRKADSLPPLPPAHKETFVKKAYMENIWRVPSQWPQCPPHTISSLTKVELTFDATYLSVSWIPAQEFLRLVCILRRPN